MLFFCFNRKNRRGFTLVQLILAIALLGALSAILLPAFSRARANADRQSCDVKLKSIVFALDAFKQERGVYPTRLDELVKDGFLTDPDALHCPDDKDDTDNGDTYDKYYVTRAPDDSGELPVLCCPMHEEANHGGNQARLGRFTTEYATRPAVLSAVNSVTVLHPGDDDASAKTGYVGMELHGGDTINTNTFGTAEITFADGSVARLQGDTKITVLQSFIDGQSSARLYTLVRELTGDATYTVHHGSRFDVATPAATAGARGTQFRITVDAQKGTNLYVIEGKVVFTSPQKSGIAPVGKWLSALDIGGLLRSLLG